MKSFLITIFFLCYIQSLQGCINFDSDFGKNVIPIYCLKRLERAEQTLQSIHKKKLFRILCSTQKTCYVFDNKIIFYNQHIKNCRNNIEHQKSLEPFFDLWRQLKKNTITIDALLFKELSMLILELYKVIYRACSPCMQNVHHKKLLFETLLFICANISQMHTLELLKIIDKLTVQIPQLLEQYEITQGKLSIKEWFAKYWWLPPLAIAALCLEITFMYQVAIGKIPQDKLSKTAI